MFFKKKNRKHENIMKFITQSLVLHIYFVDHKSAYLGKQIYEILCIKYKKYNITHQKQDPSPPEVIIRVTSCRKCFPGFCFVQIIICN